MTASCQNIVSYLKTKGIVCSEQQQKAILSGDENQDTLLLAVPGSGKTTVLVSRIAQMLLFEQYQPQEIVALTYNRAAARDMKQRFESLFGELLPQAPRFSTVHSLCYSILQQYAKRYHRSIPTLLDGSAPQLYPQNLIRQAVSQQTDAFLSNQQIDDLAAKLTCSINRMETAAERNRIEAGCDFSKLFSDYTALKRQNHLMDYDDMLTYSIQILQKLPQFLQAVTARWKWIFLDEAQDASVLQHRVLQLLSKQAKVFYVGDEDQTIYDFRGAAPEQLLNFTKLHPQGQLLRLETNYRCPKDLVAAANLLIRYNKQRYPKSMTAFGSRENSIQLVQLKDYSQQTKQVLQALEHLPKGKTAAVIASHNVSLLPVAKALSDKEMAYRRRERDFGFSASPAVRGFRQILLYAANPKDASLFAEAAKSLWFKKADVAQMQAYLPRFPNGFYAGTVCELSKYESRHAEQAAQAIAALPHQNGVEIYHTVMEVLRYQNYLAGGALADGLASAAALQVYQLRAMAEDANNLTAYLFALIQMDLFEKEVSKQTSSRITLSTIHGAKGLEFDQVFLLDTIEGCLPLLESADAPPEQKQRTLEEQTRLFYVAATRAKEQLYLYAAPKYWDQPVTSSRFIGRLTQKRGEAGRKIFHKAFGEGEILACGQDRDTVTVAFAAGVRTIQLDYCLKNGIVTMVSEPVTEKEGV